MVLSTGVPSLADKRYFLSQMSSDASWKGMASTSLCSSLTTLFVGWVPVPLVPDPSSKRGLRLKKSEPEKKYAPPPQCFAGYEHLPVERSAVRQARHFSPALPNHQDVATQHLVLGSRE